MTCTVGMVQAPVPLGGGYRAVLAFSRLTIAGRPSFSVTRHAKIWATKGHGAGSRMSRVLVRPFRLPGAAHSRRRRNVHLARQSYL